MLVLHISKRNYAIVVYLEPGLQSVRALGSRHCGLSFLVLYSDPRCFSQILQFCPLTKINSSCDVILPALGWIVVRSTNWALKLGLKGHCHAFEWNSSRVKTLKIIKIKKLILKFLLQELCEFTEFNFCLLLLRMEKDWNLKKSPEVLICAIPGQMSLIFSFQFVRNVVAFESSTKFYFCFSTTYDLKTVKQPWQCPFNDTNILMGWLLLLLLLLLFYNYYCFLCLGLH